MIQRGWRMTLPDALHLDIQEEAFSDGVVPALTFAAHAADKAVASQQIQVKPAGILPPVRMHDQSERLLSAVR